MQTVKFVKEAFQYLSWEFEPDLGGRVLTHFNESYNLIDLTKI